MNQQWTEEEDIRLAQMMKGGISYGEIGHRMGRSKNAVTGRAHRLGLVPSPVRKYPRPMKAAGPARAKRTFGLTGCQWIEGDVQAQMDVWGNVPKCGRPTIPGKSYCEAHYRRCVSSKAFEEEDE